MSLAGNRPVMIRKGERGIYSTQPGDQYIAAPAGLAPRFFASFDEPIISACDRGDASLAWDPVPELRWVGRHTRDREHMPFVLRSFPIVQVDVLGRPVCNVGLYHWRGGSNVSSREDCRARSWSTLARLNRTALALTPTTKSNLPEGLDVLREVQSVVTRLNRQTRHPQPRGHASRPTVDPLHPSSNSSELGHTAKRGLHTGSTGKWRTLV